MNFKNLKIKFISYLFSIAAFHISNAQNNERKSIENKAVENLKKSYFHFKNTQNPDSIYLFSINAYEYSKTINWEEGICQSLHREGLSYNLRGQYDLALERHLKALVFAEILKSDSLTAQIYYAIGASYGKLNKNIEGISFNTKANILFNKIKMYDSAGYALNNSGLCNGRMNKDDEALACFQQAKMTFIKTKNKFGLGIIYNNIGNTLTKKNHFSDAEQNIKKAIEIFSNAKNFFNITETNLDLARLYAKSNNVTKAISIYQSVIKTSNKLKLMNLEYDANYELNILYRKRGDYEKSYTHFNRAFQLKQLIDEDLRQKNIANLNLSYENEKQKQKEKIRELESKTQKRNLFLLVIGLIIMFIIVLFIFFTNRKLSLQNKTIEAQKQKLLELNQSIEELNTDLEKKVEVRTKELQVANEGLVRKNKEIEDALYNGQKIERKRVASELHDTLGGYLSAMRFGLMGFEHVSLPEGETKILSKVNDVLKLAYEEVRNISHNLIPYTLESHGLHTAIFQIVDELNQNSSIHFNFTGNIESKRFSKKTELEIYSICLELMNNTIKHSLSNKILISLIEDKVNIYFSFLEEGSLPKNSSTKTTIGFGSNSIAERVNSLNGQIKVTNYDFEIIVPIVVTV